MMLNWHFLDDEEQLSVNFKRKLEKPKKMTKKALLSDERDDKSFRKKFRRDQQVLAYSM
jgi:hypothetical protein